MRYDHHNQWLPEKSYIFLIQVGIGKGPLDSHDFMVGVFPPRQWSSHKDTWCCHRFDWLRESDCKDVCSPNPLGAVDFFSSKDTVLSHGWHDRMALGDMFRGGSSYSFQMHIYLSSRYLVSDAFGVFQKRILHEASDVTLKHNSDEAMNTQQTSGFERFRSKVFMSLWVDT